MLPINRQCIHAARDQHARTHEAEPFAPAKSNVSPAGAEAGSYLVGRCAARRHRLIDADGGRARAKESRAWRGFVDNYKSTVLPPHNRGLKEGGKAEKKKEEDMEDGAAKGRGGGV